LEAAPAAGVLVSGGESRQALPRSIVANVPWPDWLYSHFRAEIAEAQPSWEMRPKTNASSQ
jgi:hypothetical protein